ncbi:hypothetical protein D3C86_1621280 [compost metagenome]
MTVNFGMVFSWLLFLIGGIWVYNLAAKLGSLARFQPHTARLIRHLFVYLTLCIGFASMFNNLLFYQFWLFPMVMLLVYLTHLAKALHQRVS